MWKSSVKQKESKLRKCPGCTTVPAPCPPRLRADPDQTPGSLGSSGNGANIFSGDEISAARSGERGNTGKRRAHHARWGVPWAVYGVYLSRETQVQKVKPGRVIPAREEVSSYNYF